MLVFSTMTSALPVLYTVLEHIISTILYITPDDVHCFSNQKPHPTIQQIPIPTMRLNIHQSTARVGNAEIRQLSRVAELDAGRLTGPNMHSALPDGSLDVIFSDESLHAVERQLAIIIPCMNEERVVLEGVLHGVPHNSLIILVSNSDPCNFEYESKLLIDFCANTQRRGIVVHQQDEGLARAFVAANMPDIVHKTSQSQSNRTNAERVRNGKGEAMMVGTVLAKLAGKQYVGFIDADNFVPGAVQEYCKVFAAGLNAALHCKNDSSDAIPHSMVRLKWKSKPKIEGGKLVPQESGRCSRVVNEWMNRLLNALTGDKTAANVLRTANAGEHAMSIDLAMQLCFATGYAVEPFQLINAWECSAINSLISSATPFQHEKTKQMQASLAPLSNPIHILQIETRNPHIHDFSKGEEHIQRMQAQGLGTIYHSDLTPPKLKEDLLKYMKEELPAFVQDGGMPERARVYPALQNIDLEVFADTLKEHSETLQHEGGI
jgi:mannosyl-3-phosphoglycerate synthase